MKSKPYFYQVYSNAVYIIESLEDETKTGKWLYEDIVAFSYRDDVLRIEYFEFKSKLEFFQILNKIRREINSYGILPIIHIEAHGDERGFEVAKSTEEISWSELNDHLIEINIASQNNITLSLGICKGHYINLDLADRFRSKTRCPYAINISPQEQIGSNEIKYGFSSFYQNLLISKDFGKAMEKMQEITSLNILRTTDSFVHQIMHTIKEEFLNANKIAAQLDDLFKNERELLPGKNYNRNLREFKRFKKSFYKKQFEERWNHFLMIDLFVENKNRFPLFEEIWSDLFN
ncbi:MAG: hypothetical protein RLN88_08360 [Ekhidna sp.]|uniref:hypothetical protein n=1 Tax=Ekhidna sp. TaxID=2608089 RepID=UPI0032ED252E